MKVRKQDDTDDYVFGYNNSYYVNSIEGVSQLVKTRCLLWTGEVFLDLREGTPYQVVFNTTNHALASTLIEDRMVETEQVTAVNDFSYSVDEKRVMNISGTVITTNFGKNDFSLQNLTFQAQNNNVVVSFLTNTMGSLTASGLQIKSFTDINSDIISAAQSIFGADIVTDPSTQDMQLINILSLALYDTLSLLPQLYNSFSPATATGTALDNTVLLNGLTRKQGTRSTLDLELTGTIGTILNNCFAYDTNGNIWDLPTTFTISSSPITTTGTARNVGPVDVALGGVNIIGTPVTGWSTVVNTTTPVLGENEETDEELRERQRLSTELPSIGQTSSIVSAVLQIDGVIKARNYENSTNAVDANGVPAKSIALIVDGSYSNDDVATVLYIKKNLGCGMFGSISVPITDEYGYTQNYVFSNATTVDVYVDITIEALPTYQVSTGDVIKQNIINAIANLGIGDDIYVSQIIGAAEGDNNTTFEVMAAAIGFSAPPATTSGKITLGWDEVARALAANITITVV